jgi:hypothetical protein
LSIRPLLVEDDAQCALAVEAVRLAPYFSQTFKGHFWLESVLDRRVYDARAGLKNVRVRRRFAGLK